MALRRLAKETCSSMSSMGLGFGSAAPPAMAMTSVLSRAYAKVVDGLKYQKSHEWIKVEGDIATIGISDFAQSELGDVVYVELPEVGTTYEKSDGFGVVESVKTASDVYVPVGGEVVEANQALVDEPAKINTSPYDDGWIIKVKMSNPSDADDLLDSGAYAAHIQH